jgi:hypothetical protein
MQYTVCADSKHLKRGGDRAIERKRWHAGGASADGAALKGAHLYEYKTTIYFIPFWV